MWPGFADVYDAYSHHLVPKLGKLLANDEDSYRYLIESIERFPPMPEFAAMIGRAGFVCARRSFSAVVSSAIVPAVRAPAGEVKHDVYEALVEMHREAAADVLGGVQGPR